MPLTVLELGNAITVQDAVDKLQNLWTLKTGKYPESWIMIDTELQSSKGRPMQTVNKNKHFKIKVTTS